MEIFLSILAGCYISISLLFGAYELQNEFKDYYSPYVEIPKFIKIINRINLGIFLVSGTIFMIWFFSVMFYELVLVGGYK